MLWKRGRRSDNVVGADAGGGRRMPMGRGGGLGIGGVLIVVVIALFMGKNPSELLALLGGGGAAPTDQSDAPIDAAPQALPENEETDFVRAILGMSTSLAIEVVAEGVETVEQAAFLKAQGCTGFQGYLFGRPQPVEAWPPEWLGATAG